MCFLFSVFTGEDECGAFPRVHHGKLKKTKKTFQDGETTTFECDPGFRSTPRSIRCINGKWEKPVCEGELLKLPLHVREEQREHIMDDIIY